MHPVTIPDNELNEFDLPRVCIVTGEEQRVVFKDVRFQWYPPWVAVFVLCSPIIFAIVAMIMMKRVQGQLPFTEEAFAAWRRGQVAMGLSVLLAVAAFVGAIIAFDNDLAPVGALALLACFAGPIAAWVVLLKGRAPKVVKIKDGQTELKIPSETAAARIAAHLAGGARRTVPVLAG